MSSEAPLDEGTATPSARAILVVLLRGRRVIVAGALALGFALGLSAITSRPMFRASVSFYSQGSPGDMPGLASLAGQFGFNIPTMENGPGPDFFHTLLGTREVLTKVVMRPYRVVDGDEVVEGTLLDVLELEAPTEAERLSLGLDWVRERALTASVHRETGIVQFSILTPWPEVSLRISEALLEELHDFNTETRRSQAGSERGFLEARLEVAKEELLAAETELQTFLQQNRLFVDSPELLFRHDRLQRLVTMRQQVYTGLTEAHEQARIREVRDTPILTVIEPPILPPRREPRGTVKKTLFGLFFGAGLAMAWLVFVPNREGVEVDPDAQALEEAWADAKADLTRWLPFGSRGR